MYHFWTGLVELLLRELKPRTIVEIGSERGNHTRYLAAFCQRTGAVLHAIDPQPRFDVAAWQRAYGGALVVHECLSLEALPWLDGLDVVLIDGDHNWYTVYHELQAIEARAAALGQPLPFSLLHDVGWPYGRRDAYYQPATIPAEYRQPYRRAGIQRHASELHDQWGVNAHLSNALHEGGPRNGVLTAVEDYRAATAHCLQFSQAPGFHGLGLLASCALLTEHPALARLFQQLNEDSAPIRRRRALEERRLALDIRVKELQRLAGPHARRPAALPRLLTQLQRRLVSQQLSLALRPWPVP